MRTNLKTLVAGLVVFGLVVFTYMQLIGLIERAEGALNGRVLSMMEYLPDLTELAEDNEIVLVIGSSMVQAGFDPLIFDDTLAQSGIGVMSFNYGVGNLNPRFQEILTQRIREAFERGGQDLRLALVEFNPFQTTTRRNESTAVMDEQNIALLSTPMELWQATLDDPSSGTRMFVIRYLRKGYSAELMTSLPSLVGNAGDPAILRSDEFRAAQAELRAAGSEFGQAITADNLPESTLPGWDPALRGGRVDASLLSDATLATLPRYSEAQRHPLFMQLDVDSRDRTADILGLGFDETLIQAFIEMVRDLQAVSQTVEVVLLPRNTEWVNYAPQVQARLDGVKDRIARETGVLVRDLQTHPAVEPRHFSDSTHLGFEGSQVFSRALAAEFLEQLR